MGPVGREDLAGQRGLKGGILGRRTVSKASEARRSLLWLGAWDL